MLLQAWTTTARQGSSQAESLSFLFFFLCGACQAQRAKWLRAQAQGALGAQGQGEAEAGTGDDRAESRAERRLSFLTRLRDSGRRLQSICHALVTGAVEQLSRA